MSQQHFTGNDVGGLIALVAAFVKDEDIEDMTFQMKALVYKCKAAATPAANGGYDTNYSINISDLQKRGW